VASLGLSLCGRNADHLPASTWST